LEKENFEDYLLKEEKAFPVLNCFENQEYIGIGIIFKNDVVHYFLMEKIVYYEVG